MLFTFMFKFILKIKLSKGFLTIIFQVKILMMPNLLGWKVVQLPMIKLLLADILATMKDIHRNTPDSTVTPVLVVGLHLRLTGVCFVSFLIISINYFRLSIVFIDCTST